MTYNPLLKLYYLKNGESPNSGNRLLPAPQISINPEFVYANDTIIGYTYNVTLTGYATSLDLSKPIDPNNTPDFDDVLESIQKVKNIFNGNGGKLFANNQNGQVLFELTGATIRGINFQESANNWVNFAEYTIELEFNEIKLGDCSGSGISINCGQIPQGITDSPELIDMKTYKVKSFNDSWNFSLDDNIYNTDGSVRNEHFNISYTINVTGKHYFNQNRDLLPAWEQAKNFAEFKLHQQVNRLNTGILRRTGSSSGCSTDGTLSSIFRAGPPGLIDGLADANYKIYNEKVSCSTSEGAGTFSLEYTAILKRYSFSQYSDPSTIHTYSTTKDATDDGFQKNTTISVNGSIQGLLEGGIVKSPSVISFPANGSVIISVPNNTNTNKYSNAKITFDLISDGKSLNQDFAQFLGVSNQALGVSGACIDPSGAPIKSSTFNVTHDYSTGSINYSTQYDTTSACADLNRYQSVTINVQEKTPITAEFIVPGRSAGPIIQKINANNPKRITLSITGSNPPSDCCASIDSLIGSGCDGSLNISGLPPAEIAGTILVRNSSDFGTDGTYSINREYIVCDN